MNSWEKFRKGVEERYPLYCPKLNAPAGEELIGRLESKVGNLPEAFKNIYHSCNGEVKGSKGFVFGLSLLSVEQILDEMDVFCQIISDGIDDLSEFCESKIVGLVKPEYLNRKWVPFLSDFGGNYIGVDLDPDSKGKIGQVINFGRDEEIKYVFAKDLEEFFTLLVNMFNSELVVVENGIYSYDFYHFIDALKKAHA